MSARRGRGWAAVVAALLTLGASGGDDSAVALVEAGETRARELPPALREVSGLTFQGPDTLWAHDDERGAVYALDPATGAPFARRVLGPRDVLADFEGVAWDGDHLHLVTSTGTLVSFRPGDAETVTGYGVRETTARALCEVEGLAWDPTRGTLVMACKEVLDGERDAGLMLLEVDRPPGPTDAVGGPLPARVLVTVPRDTLRAAGLPRRLALSDIALDPARDSWLLVAARQRRVVELARDGTVLAHATLDRRRHPQAEGLALSPDRGTLYLADEGGGGAGSLHLYGGGPRP